MPILHYKGVMILAGDSAATNSKQGIILLQEHWWFADSVNTTKQILHCKFLKKNYSQRKSFSKYKYFQHEMMPNRPIELIAQAQPNPASSPL